MKIRNGIFPKLVIEEAKALKKNATKEEKDKLDIDRLNSRNLNKCIYGQMTENCNSDRAFELMSKGCKRVYIGGGENPSTSKKLNGAAKNCEKRHTGYYPWYSPIEVFIDSAPREMNNILIKFIKGKVKTLKSK